MKFFVTLIFLLLVMNTNAQSDIDDGSGSIIKLVCKYTDPQYPSFKVYEKTFRDRGSEFNYRII